MSATLAKTKTPGIYKRGSRYVVTWRDRAGRQRRQSAGTLAEARDLKAKNHNKRGPAHRIRFVAYARRRRPSGVRSPFDAQESI
jgi:hypothetical protein